MRFYVHRDPLHFGILPTETHTGVIDTWIVQLLTASLGLIQIVEALFEHASTDGWWLNAAKGIHITSFNDTEDGETIYHMKVDLARDWARGMFAHWPDDIEQNSTCLNWQHFRYKPEYCERCPEHEHLRWVDLTSYRLRPIPHTLLRDIYDLSGLSPDWKVGRRDMKMSSKASDVLKGWVDSQQWEENVSEEDFDAYQDV